MNSRLTHPLFGAESMSQQRTTTCTTISELKWARIAAQQTPLPPQPVDDDSAHPVEQQRAGDHQRRQRQDGRRCGKVTGAKEKSCGHNRGPHHVTRNVPLSLLAGLTRRRNASARWHRRVALRGPASCVSRWRSSSPHDAIPNVSTSVVSTEELSQHSVRTEPPRFRTGTRRRSRRRSCRRCFVSCARRPPVPPAGRRCSAG
jgi:ribosomal protein L32